MYSHLFAFLVAIFAAATLYFRVDNPIAAIGMALVAVGAAVDIYRHRGQRTVGGDKQTQPATADESGTLPYDNRTVLRWIRHGFYITGLLVLILGAFLLND